MRPIRQRDRGGVREALALYARHFLYVCTDTEIACSADWLGFNLSRRMNVVQKTEIMTCPSDIRT